MKIKNLYSAIIGYWRQGATLDEIKAITGVSKWEIAGIIASYSRLN